MTSTSVSRIAPGSGARCDDRQASSFGSRRRRRDPGLPPGQRRIDGFPRFGTHLARPAPAVPADPVLRIRGAVIEAIDVPLADLAALPRREVRADFHCVTGWTASDLRWEGVAVETFYRHVVEPVLAPDTVVTHLVFGGLDGYRSTVDIDDALADGVLIAEHLDGQPLDGDHGAPVRLVSPAQYGYVSTKHLCSIEVHTVEPKASAGSALANLLFGSHPRARVWREERNPSLPAWLVRPIYRALIAPIRALCARGSLRRRGGAR